MVGACVVTFAGIEVLVLVPSTFGGRITGTPFVVTLTSDDIGRSDTVSAGKGRPVPVMRSEVVLGVLDSVVGEPSPDVVL